MVYASKKHQIKFYLYEIWWPWSTAYYNYALYQYFRKLPLHSQRIHYYGFLSLSAKEIPNKSMKCSWEITAALPAPRQSHLQAKQSMSTHHRRGEGMHQKHPSQKAARHFSQLFRWQATMRLTLCHSGFGWGTELPNIKFANSEIWHFGTKINAC